MLVYQNCSNATRTFYGITFKPYEIHAVPRAIIAVNMMRVSESALRMQAKPATGVKSSITPPKPKSVKTGIKSASVDELSDTSTSDADQTSK